MAYRRGSVGTCVPERRGRSTHGRTGGDDVVDDDHPTSVEARSGDEFGTVETLDATAAGLGDRRSGSNQEAAARHAELAGDVTGHQLALVEPARASPRRAGRRPRDQVEVAMVAVGDDRVDHQTGQMSRHLAPIAVLQPEHHPSPPAP